ncbi:MAG: hypothetical protein ACXAEN_14755 [Candidatus Thorarchaeota archaeon]|jgi:hypothetical protein
MEDELVFLIRQALEKCEERNREEPRRYGQVVQQKLEEAYLWLRAGLQGDVE